MNTVGSAEHAVLLCALATLGLCAELLPLILVLLKFLLGLDLLWLGRLHIAVLVSLLLGVGVYRRARRSDQPRSRWCRGR